MVCGSRGWRDRTAVAKRLANAVATHGDSLTVIHNEQSGADRYAADWCDTNGIRHVAFSSDFGTHGHLAPRRRDMAMVEFLAEQRDETGCTVEIAAFRTSGDTRDRVGAVINMARRYRIHGTAVAA